MWGDEVEVVLFGGVVVGDVGEVGVLVAVVEEWGFGGEDFGEWVGGVLKEDVGCVGVDVL